MQSAHPINTQSGTLRGLHWQAAPHEEAKLVRCSRGAIYDVIVDLRPNSLAFKHWRSLTLTARSQMMLFVPKGFSHGFQTLLDDAR